VKKSKKKSRLSRAGAAAVDKNLCHTNHVLDHKTWELAPGLIWANLVSCILRILKFRFLRVATSERFFKVLLFRPQGPVYVVWKLFYRVQEAGFSKENCCQIYPRMKSLEQNLNFALGTCMRNKEKLLFY
jgi:hypothetical protein